MENFKKIELTADVPLADLAGFRHVDRFERLCRECPAYGAVWGCPPLTADELAVPDKFERVKLTGVKIVPTDTDLPLSESERLIQAVRVELEPRLLELERSLRGFSALFTGRCYHCSDGCVRRQGLPCRHPSLRRTSLEALGYDLSAIAKNVFDTDLLWGKNNRLPEYLFILAGVFY